ncbi:MAG: ABC-type molybdenum transport system, ATPase component/photorepair protein PhrA [Chitinophagaceae bacterium]|nr:ABC-type molybdenum transport system, ATPase component/photorepair protein PhrA [Chitinophagaceae bacterium]
MKWIEAKNITVIAEDKMILDDISFSLYKGDALAIVGPSGSGKTTLGKIIAGQWASSSGQLVLAEQNTTKRLFISQQHDFRYLSSTRSYYQQRYDSNVADDSPTVAQLFEKTATQDFSEWVKLLKLEQLLTSRLTLLSNGEGKRVQLAQALLQKTEVLVLDNPFIGLDPPSRQLLHEIIQQFITRGILVVVITSYSEIPHSITQVLELESGKVKQFVEREEFSVPLAQQENQPVINPDVLDLLGFPEEAEFEYAVRMKNVTVNYGDKVILDRINWEVKKGEQWALIGHNGAGKSTLLSLINGDNPQAYNNEIYLFDQRRGSGESIWDIKRKVGYISPELHIYFQRDVSHTEAVALSSGEPSPIKFSQARITCENVVTSGFNDQVGSSQGVTPMQRKQALRWMDVLQIKSLSGQNMYDASLGEQRLVLLARALVKNPALLILDEPCQGLDAEQTKRFTEVVDAVCGHFNKTLIYISHYKQDIPKCVTKVLMLEKGRIVG